VGAIVGAIGDVLLWLVCKKMGNRCQIPLQAAGWPADGPINVKSSNLTLWGWGSRGALCGFWRLCLWELDDW